MTFELENTVRLNIKNLVPYSSARDEFEGEHAVFLDANENPFGTLNRYPDPHQKVLKHALSKAKNLNPENLFLGNGSDEIIDLLYRIFCRPGVDKALTFWPSFAMFEAAAGINDVPLTKLQLDDDFDIPLDDTKQHLNDQRLKIIFICSPNNPTGNSFSIDHIEYILSHFNGIVVVDEAYSDFCQKPSWARKIHQHPNLVVLQTLSKAWGLAAARIGMAITNPEIIELLNRVKMPYNISLINQHAALKALDDEEGFQQNVQIILYEKKRLISALEKLNIVEKIFPSDANFLLVKFTEANKTYSDLVAQKVITRNRHKLVDNCLRITVGSPDENAQLITALKTLNR